MTIEALIYYIGLTVLVFGTYIILYFWSEWEFGKRAEADHRCTCRAFPDDFCHYCGN